MGVEPQDQEQQWGFPEVTISEEESSEVIATMVLGQKKKEIGGQNELEIRIRKYSI